MSRFTSTNYSQGSFNIATLILRLTFGFIILWHHGVAKLKDFSTLQYTFFDPFHIGHRWSRCWSTPRAGPGSEPSMMPFPSSTALP